MTQVTDLDVALDLSVSPSPGATTPLSIHLGSAGASIWQMRIETAIVTLLCCGVSAWRRGSLLDSDHVAVVVLG